VPSGSPATLIAGMSGSESLESLGALRAKTALAAAKARGVKLGNPNGARALRGKQVGNTEAVEQIKANAAQRASDLAGIVTTSRASGLTSVRSIAEALNEQGIRAPRGDTWHPTAVSRLLKRLSAHGANAVAQAARS
jgi:hypothetical protein